MFGLGLGRFGLGIIRGAVLGYVTELPASGGVDHFGINGATFPFYDATQPSAFYDSPQQDVVCLRGL
jgi:hypothetical protein